MIRKVLFFILFSAALSAHAQIDCNLVHRTDFDEVTAGLARLNKPLGFMNASAQIEMTQTDPKTNKKIPGGCSGSFISDQGEILTAAHCLRGCSEQMPCTFFVNGKEQELEIVQNTVCGVKTIVAKYEKGEETKEACQLTEGIDDILVLRPKDPSKLGDFSCLSISDRKTSLNESVFTMGNPSDTSRGVWEKAKDAKNMKLMISSGETIQSDSCELLWRPRFKVQEWIYGKAKSEKTPLPTQFTNDMGMIQTTVDIVRGSSGGALIDSNGEIVGVASIILKPHNNFKECRGATFFQPVSKLNKKLEGKVSPCRERKANPGASI